MIWGHARRHFEKDNILSFSDSPLSTNLKPWKNKTHTAKLHTDSEFQVAVCQVVCFLSYLDLDIHDHHYSKRNFHQVKSVCQI